MNFRSIKTASVVGIATMLVVLVAIGCYGLAELNKLNEVNKSLKHTSGILVNLHSIFASVKDAETGQRGFLITGNESYLAPYNNVSSKVNESIKELRRLTANNPDQNKDITILENIVIAKLAEINKTIELRRTKGFEAAREVVLTNRGRDQMELIRNKFAQIYEHENELLVESRNEQDNRAKNAFLWLLFLCGVAIVFQVIMGLITINFLNREKLATDKLREQAELLDLTRDAVLVRDLDATIRYWNRGAEKMYGFKKVEAVGQIMYDFLKTESPQPLTEIEGEILKKGFWEGELIHTTRDGRRLIIASRHILKTDEQSKPVGVLVNSTDITIHKEAERRQMALAEMKRENTELEQFASIASHDLQEPLRAVAGCLQILEKSYKDKLDPEATELIHYAVDGSLRMRNLINDLLSLSRASKSDPILERTDLTEVLKQALQNIELTVVERNAVITHDPLPVLTVEKTLLVQLFQNLLSNAIKFCKDKSPEIHISAHQKDQRWQICVRDNGIGFEKEYAEKIFQPFQRLHGRDEYPGSGIGLAICKRIVERHAGTIWAESEPGKGTTFCFTLTDFGQVS